MSELPTSRSTLLAVDEVFCQWLERQPAQRMSFEAFMQAALYDPAMGYYTTRIRDVGGQVGDFATAATLHPVLSEAICVWLKQRAKAFGWGQRAEQPCAIIELGAGNGALAAGVQKALRGAADEAFWCRHFVVETSPVLRQRVSDVVKEYGITLAESVEEALGACDGRALIFSNEFVDAFPVVRLRWEDDEWREGFMQRDAESGAIYEVTGPHTLTRDCQIPEFPREGMTVNIHRSFADWMWAMDAKWQAGAMLTIDYGQSWPTQELRAYQEHQVFEKANVLNAMGQRDITADVNFGDLRQWGEMLGWEFGAFSNQLSFIRGMLPDADTRYAGDDAFTFLMQENGAGGAFQILEQLKQLGSPS